MWKSRLFGPKHNARGNAAATNPGRTARRSSKRTMPAAFEQLEDRVLQSATQTAAIQFNGSNAGARMGNAVSQVSGMSIVGSYMATVGTLANAGNVKLYTYNGSSATLSRTLTEPSGAANAYFGYSVAGTSDGFVIVGAIGSGTNTGKVYLFNASTGALVKTISNPTPAAGDQFGCSVAAVGTNILIGAKGDDNNSLTDDGAAYLYDRTGTLLATYVSPTKAASTYFGTSVTCANSNPVVGAFYDNTGATRSGRVYEFNNTLRGTVSTALVTFSNPTVAADDHFGISIAGYGTQLIVGADGDDTNAVNSGAAYLFNATSGAIVKTMLNPAAAASDGFGNSVALSATRALVGSQAYDYKGLSNSGATYMFDTSTGALTNTFYSPAPLAGDNFGSSVSFLGTNVIIGAAAADAAGVDSGSWYLFKPV